MPDNQMLDQVSETIEQATGYDPKPPMAGAAPSILSWLVKAGELLPPWWTPARDKALARLWKQSDHLASAMYNAQAKLAGIPFQIVPSDPSNMDHARIAEEMADNLLFLSEFGQGWLMCYEKFIEDLLGTDNGGFMEIIGPGDPDGPIIGRPLAVRHMASSRCTRTGNPEFPVVYLGDDGKRYAIHWTRVIFMSQMPSPIQEMNGVGVCAISRSANIAQTMMDAIIYKQEKMGTRPQDQIIVGKGITGGQIMEAMWAGEEAADNESRRRFAKTVAIGSENPDISLEVISLNHKDPFDEEMTLNFGMFAIAAAFGMDASELWPTGRGSTNKADTDLRRQRSRGKLPAQTASNLEAQFNMKFMPVDERGQPYLRMRFDFKDDEEDQQRAVIQDIRARNMERGLNSGTMSVRVARQRMMDQGDISRPEFNMMEIDAGRLPDGQEVGVLYFSSEPVFDRHLSPLQDLLVVRDNIGTDVGDEEQRTESLITIEKAKSGVLEELAKTTSDKKREQLKMSCAALNWLHEKYEIEGRNEFFDKVPPGMRRFTTDSIYQERVDKRPQEELDMEAEQQDADSDQGRPTGQDGQQVTRQDTTSGLPSGN